VASITASSIHTFTAESSQVLIGKCSSGSEEEEEGDEREE
jgi:D-lyxose ketol-isomerase